MVKQVVVYDTETGEISQAIIDAFKAANPVAVSTDAGNIATLGTDNLIFVQAPEGGSGITTVAAGTNLSTDRPTGAGVVYWMFDNGVDVGTDGANVVNGLPGDLFYVAGA